MFLLYIFTQYRVANLAHKIASECNKKDDITQHCGNLRVVFIGGLIHDVLDSKLITEGNNAELIESELKELLKKEGCNEDEVFTLIQMTKLVGYSKLLKNDYWSNESKYPAEYKAVQVYSMFIML